MLYFLPIIEIFAWYPDIFVMSRIFNSNLGSRKPHVPVQVAVQSWPLQAVPHFIWLEIWHTMVLNMKRCHYFVTKIHFHQIFACSFFLSSAETPASEQIFLLSYLSAVSEVSRTLLVISTLVTRSSRPLSAWRSLTTLQITLERRMLATVKRTMVLVIIFVDWIDDVDVVGLERLVLKT